ncbi:MAG: DUF4834 family protein [Bacteroidota bacterium]
MQEFLLTLVVVFVLFRIFGKSRVQSSTNYYTFNQNNFTKKETPKQPDGKVRIDKMPNANSSKSNTNDSGDYVDYEEIK